MTDNAYNGRRFLRVDTLGGRQTIDIEVGQLRDDQPLVYDGINNRVYTTRRNPWRAGVSLTNPSLSEYTAYTNWLGDSKLLASDFGADTAWSDIENPSFLFSRWAPWAKAFPNNTLVLALHIMPNSFWTTASNLVTAAGGGFDAHINTLGDNIVASGLKKLIIRLDHEFNLHAIPSAANWRTYWTHCVDLLRAKFTAASGVKAMFCWNFSLNASKPPGTTDVVTLDDLWPGGYTQATGTGSVDAMTLIKYPYRRRWACPQVDFVGIDIYDEYGNGYTTNVQPTAAQQYSAFWGYLTNFNEYQATAGNLDYASGSMMYASALARETNTPLCVPEWGCWALNASFPTGGDNPIFVRKMHEWLKASNVSWASYFDVWNTTYGALHQLWPGSDNAFVTSFPSARDEYLRLF